MVLADLLGGPDILIVLVIVLVLFGGSQLPKLARSLGSAKQEFEKGLVEGKDEAAAKAAKDATDDKGKA